MIKTRIPNLAEDRSAGLGKPGKAFKVRLPSSKESGDFRLDFEIVHEIASTEEAKELEGFLPGAASAFGLSFGTTTDGIRPLEWRPKDPECQLLLAKHDVDSTATDKRGDVLYESSAEVRRAQFKVSENASFFTIFFTLTNPTDALLAALRRSMRQPLEYEIAFGGASVALAPVVGGLFAQGPQDAPDASPQGSDALMAGDLATFAPEDGIDEIAGIVVSIDDDRVILHQDLGGYRPVECRRDQILSVVPICGPKGGPASPKIKDYVASCSRVEVEPEAIWLIRAVLEASELGEPLPNGWPLTTEVLDRAVELAEESSSVL
jgi:hypothetical protein